MKHSVWLEKFAKQKKPPPHLWVICAGYPRRAFTALGFKRSAAWPQGGYTLAAGWKVTAFVVSELPPGRQTLLLRLLGAGAVLQRAIVELDTLPVDGPEHRVAGHSLVELRDRIRSDPAAKTLMEDLMTALERADKWRDRLLTQGQRVGLQKGLQKGLQQGRQEGRQEGAAELLKKLLKLKFPKATSAELARLDDATGKQLEKWSERVLFAGSLDEIFR